MPWRSVYDLVQNTVDRGAVSREFKTKNAQYTRVSVKKERRSSH